MWIPPCDVLDRNVPRATDTAPRRRRHHPDGGRGRPPRGRAGRLEGVSNEIEIGRGKRGRRAYSFDDIAVVPSRRTRDPKDVSTAAHMFGCWETLYVIKNAMEASGYQGPQDKVKLIEATEAMTEFPEGPEHPQGPKTFNGKIHQCFGIQNISKVENGRMNVVHKTSIEDGLYEPEGDYTTMPL